MRGDVARQVTCRPHLAVGGVLLVLPDSFAPALVHLWADSFSCGWGGAAAGAARLVRAAPVHLHPFAGARRPALDGPLRLVALVRTCLASFAVIHA